MSSRKGAQGGGVVRTRKGATAARPIFELWKDYSEVPGGREDVDGGGLRVDPEEAFFGWAEWPGHCRGIGPLAQDGGQGDRQRGSGSLPAERTTGTTGDRAVPDDHRCLAGAGPVASAEATAHGAADLRAAARRARVRRFGQQRAAVRRLAKTGSGRGLRAPVLRPRGRGPGGLGRSHGDPPRCGTEGATVLHEVLPQPCGLRAGLRTGEPGIVPGRSRASLGFLRRGAQADRL